MACGICVFSKEESETCGQFLGRQSNTIQDNFHTFPVLSQDRLQEGDNYPVVNLMHRVAHIHQVNTEMWNEPKCIEQKMCPRLLPLGLIVLCAWMNRISSILVTVVII